MNLLIVGGGKAGSWIMRGQQLGAALGARVSESPSDDDIRWADVVVLVKRAAYIWAPRVHAFRRPLVWDILDGWSQPNQNDFDEARARVWLRQQLTTIEPTLAIGATEAMATAAEGSYLPHHSRLGLVPTDARRKVSIVGYDGSPAYLGSWAARVTRACAARGWTFVVNPADLSQTDIIVSFRDGVWDGWMCRQWKSGVKAVNAICAGRPFIAQPSAAVAELGPPGSVVSTEDELQAAFDAWSSYEARQRVVEWSRRLAPSYAVDAVAEVYRGLLATVEVARA